MRHFFLIVVSLVMLFASQRALASITARDIANARSDCAKRCGRNPACERVCWKEFFESKKPTRASNAVAAVRNSHQVAVSKIQRSASHVQTLAHAPQAQHRHGVKSVHASKMVVARSRASVIGASVACLVLVLVTCFA
jgi:hypothetical protein